MKENTAEHPHCFGDLNKVFPPGEDGLRYSPDACRIACQYKTECLKTAMAGKTGLAAQETYVDRAYQSGMIGFFERWSRKKYLKNKTERTD